MSREAIVEKIKEELIEADGETLDLLLETLQKSKKKRPMPSEKFTSILSGSLNRKTPPRQTLEFIGENLSFEEIDKLSIKERGELQRRLKEQNKEWLREKFTTLNALWIMVVDGQIKSWGKKKKDYPQAEQIMEICQSTGKYPFIFINDDRLAIEESSSGWHRLDVDDYYPTIPLTLRSDSGAAKLVADFDTGSPFSFVNYDLLLAEKVVQRRPAEYVENAIHLGKQYQCVSKIVKAEFEATSGQARSFVTTVYCVEDRPNSPFVRINPNRIALIGRDLPFEAKLSLGLHFDKQRTEIIPATSKRQKGKSKKA